MSRIVGECRQCGRCCHFSYWVLGNSALPLSYHKEYAARFWDEFEFHVGPLNAAGFYTALVVVPSIPCRHLGDDNHCRLHGPDKPQDCKTFPHHMDPKTFAAIRLKDCGFTVE